RLAEIDAAIAKHQALLDDLQSDRNLVQHQIDSIVYPILTLPLDVTLEILGYCNSSDRLRVYWSPTVLLRICRKWRDIALGNPTLW
ncbi:hypothetical protein B0H13DRAFT_1490766, partial [Mycena leptocephala]